VRCKSLKFKNSIVHYTWTGMVAAKEGSIVKWLSEDGYKTMGCRKRISLKIDWNRSLESTI